MKRVVTLGTLAALAALALVWGSVAHEAATVDGIVGDGEYEYMYTDEGLNMTVHWMIDTEEGVITVALEAPTQGWVGIGFAPTGEKKQGADQIMGMFHDEDGETDSLDAYQEAPVGAPAADTFLGGTDDLLEKAAVQTEGGTTFEFSRKLDTGDAYDAALKPGEIQVLLAYGEKDDFANYHGQQRVAVTIDLFEGTVSTQGQGD